MSIKLKSAYQTKKIIKVMDELYPEAECELIHHNPFELLIAVILSAQTTDVAVNKVTPALFARFPDPLSLAQAGPSEVEPYIQSIGLYRNKAKHIVACSQQLITEFGGEVPRSREALMSLAGVGRKTANVVMSVAFGLPALAVDTHVERVSKRLDLVEQQASPLQVEQQLVAKLTKKSLGKAHHSLIFFGRYFCTAKKPNCAQCPLLNYCRFGQSNV